MTPSLLTPDSALFLDIDGTLIDFVPRPEDARISPSVLNLIDALRDALGGALALISGRALADVDRLFFPLTLAVAGQHGAELRVSPDDDVQVFATHQVALAAVLDAMRPFLAAHPAIRVERKGLSTAFHYRGAEADGAALRVALDAAIAPHHEVLQRLDSVLCQDVRPRDANKGEAVMCLMAVAPFAGRVPVYIGDDVTDEDGFAATLGLGGRAIRIGAPRPTRATENLADPAALRDWLTRSAQSLES